MQKCFIESLNSTKLIYHMGGFGLDWLSELSVYSLVDCHPGLKGTNVSLSEVAYRAAISHMGSG